MSKVLRDLAAATQYRRFSSEHDLDIFITERFPRASADEKIAMKLTLAAEKKFSLAAQQETYTPGESAVDKSLRELGITGPVSLDDLEKKMDAMNWPPTMRIAAKIQCQQRGWLSYGAGHRMSAQTGLATDQTLDYGLATDRARYEYGQPEPSYRPGMTEPERLLAKLRVTVPLTLADLEQRMTEAGMDAETRISCKLEAQQKQLLKG
jgi:hypothetical protein